MGWPFSQQQQQPKTECRCTSKRISVDEKMVLVGKDNDYNNDGKVTVVDLYYDGVNNYDTNSESVLSRKGGTAGGIRR